MIEFARRFLSSIGRFLGINGFVKKQKVKYEEFKQGKRQFRYRIVEVI